MGAANHMRIGLASSPPCERFRPRYIPRGGNSAASNELALPAYGNHRSAPLIAFIAAAALVGFATNLSMHLLNLRMQTMGVSGIGIGLSVAVQALGIMIAAPLTKHVIAVIGVRYTLGLGALLASSTLCIFNFVSDPIAWNSVRLAFAIGLAVLFTASESLIISRADSSN